MLGVFKRTQSYSLSKKIMPRESVGQILTDVRNPLRQVLPLLKNLLWRDDGYWGASQLVSLWQLLSLKEWTWNLSYKYYFKQKITEHFKLLKSHFYLMLSIFKWRWAKRFGSYGNMMWKYTMSFKSIRKKKLSFQRFLLYFEYWLQRRKNRKEKGLEGYGIHLIFIRKIPTWK